MKIKIGIAVIANLIAIAAFADSDLQKMKPVTRIDFNQLIEESNEQKQDLVENRVKPESLSSAQENKEVNDFVDVEIGVGQDPAVVGVDRRYNSVGEAKVVEIEALSVRMISKTRGS